VILGNGVAEAVASVGSAGAVEIGVTLLTHDLPAPGAGRRAAVSARQQRVLDTLPAGKFRVKRRYELLSGFAASANPAAIDALVRHPEVTHIYLGGRVHANLAQGVPLVGADTAHSMSLTGAGVNIAVLDTGIDSNHPDLATSLIAEQCFCDDHPSPMKVSWRGIRPEAR